VRRSEGGGDPPGTGGGGATRYRRVYLGQLEKGTDDLTAKNDTPGNLARRAEGGLGKGVGKTQKTDRRTCASE